MGHESVLGYEEKTCLGQYIKVLTVDLVLIFIGTPMAAL